MVTYDEHIIRLVLQRFGEDPDREGLKETPSRVLKAWDHFTSGYALNCADVLKSFEDGGEEYDGMVTQFNIPFYSNCEHHMVPFFGLVHIGYIPQGRIVGLSKLARLTDVFARRLQVQERLTRQIVDGLMEHLKPMGAGVVIQARHLCMEARGVQKMGTLTGTSVLRGNFLEPEVRAEFLALVNAASEHST